jgi:hypothetical protein
MFELLFIKKHRSYSGLLTTCGGSQEVCCSGLRRLRRHSPLQHE